MYDYGLGVAQDSAEALRLYQLAAAQGHPTALYRVAVFHECGLGGVAVDVAKAIHWYSCAQAAGEPDAADKLLRLVV
jgi:TPR repeat protein